MENIKYNKMNVIVINWRRKKNWEYNELNRQRAEKRIIIEP